MIRNGTLDKKNATFTSVRKMIEKVSEGQRKEINTQMETISKENRETQGGCKQKTLV